MIALLIWLAIGIVLLVFGLLMLMATAMSDSTTNRLPLGPPIAAAGALIIVATIVGMVWHWLA